MEIASNGQEVKLVINILNELREKCPWDKKQTIQSLKNHTIEELYELVDAIDKCDWKNIGEELGDLLLHVLFYIKIGTEQGHLTLDSVCANLVNKLIERHPHIYGNVQVNNEEDVKRNWEKIKLKEENKTLFSGVPNALPAVIKALRIQEKAKQVGFEWDNVNDVWLKVQEEISELKEAVELQQRQRIQEEFGDVMFSLINYARFIGVDPETALQATNQKFIHRFTLMEKFAQEDGVDFPSLSLQQMDVYWNKAKQVNIEKTIG